MSAGADLRRRIEGFLAAQLPPDADVVVDEPVLLGGGSSKENWSFDATWIAETGRSRHELMLRQDPVASVVVTRQRDEFALLRALAPAGLPTPVARWIDEAGAWFDRPAVVVTRCPGRADRAALRERDPLGLGRAAQVRLAGELVDLLAGVHGLDPHASGVAAVLPDPGPDPARAELERWEAALAELQRGGHPAFVAARAWLHAQVPAPVARASLLHGDFRPANVLVHDGRVSALLDWELAHLGDPADDLGWYTCSIYRKEHTIPGAWEVGAVTGRYAAQTGVDLGAGRLRFWQVLSVFRLAVIALRAARNIEAGRAAGPLPPLERLERQLLLDIADEPLA